MRKKILLTGGGTGGHIFPLLAVAEEIRKRDKGIELVYLGPDHRLNEVFLERGIRVCRIFSSKWRRYLDLRNLVDVPKFFLSFLQAAFWLLALRPDLVFSKGGPGALPVVLIARIYFIPAVIHDSDAVPGLANRLSAPFAKKIFLAWKSAATRFPKKKTEIVGNPIRSEFLLNRPPDGETAKKRLKLNPREPLIVFLAGSQGATRINDFVFKHLGKLLQMAAVIHQVGERNVNEAAEFEAGGRYRFAGFFDAHEFKLILSAADVIVSRAGAGAIFEIASFGKPAILIPLKESAGGHQRINAYEYARLGAALVIEETELSWDALRQKIEKILKDQKTAASMSAAGRRFAKPDAAEIVAERLLNLI